MSPPSGGPRPGAGRPQGSLSVDPEDRVRGAQLSVSRRVFGRFQAWRAERRLSVTAALTRLLNLAEGVGGEE